MELFKNIPEFENKYQVSTTGKVKSLGNKKRKKEKLLKTSFNSKGYLTVALYSSGIRKTFTVHQLVAITFLNHKLNGYNVVVDHIDNNKANNHVNNLQLVSQRGNVQKPHGKTVGVKKQGTLWMVTVSFSSFLTQEDAINFRRSLINHADNLMESKKIE